MRGKYFPCHCEMNLFVSSLPSGPEKQKFWFGVLIHWFKRVICHPLNFFIKIKYVGFFHQFLNTCTRSYMAIYEKANGKKKTSECGLLTFHWLGSLGRRTIKIWRWHLCQIRQWNFPSSPKEFVLKKRRWVFPLQGWYRYCFRLF